MKTTKMDIDKIAAKAMAELDDQPLRPEDLPIKPLYWTVVVEPLKAKTKTESGLIIAEQAQEVEEIQMTLGTVLAIGSLAFKGRTESGVSLGDEENKPKVGDVVVFARYTGQKLKVRNARTRGKDRIALILNDSELLGIVHDPDAIRFWL